MKILQYSLYYFPDKTGIAVTSTEVAEWFAAGGHEVTVLTGLPFYPEWKIDERYRKVRHEVVNGVSIYRVPLYVPARVKTLTRILHELSFIVTAFLRCVSIKKPDVIIVVTPPLFLGFVALFFGRWWRRPVFLNVKDLVPDAAIELGMLKNRWMIRFFLWSELLLYRRVQKIASLGNGVLLRIRNKGIPEEKLHFLPDTGDPKLLLAERKPKSQNAFLLANKIDAEFLVLHSGNMGVKQGLDVIVEAASELKGLPIRFYFVGDGAVKESIISKANILGLSNVTFLPLQPREWLADMYHSADIALLTQRSEVVDIVVPSKLLSMMAAGSCVIASAAAESEAAKIMYSSGCGTVVPPEDCHALADAIRFYYEHREEILEKRHKAQEYVRNHYDRDTVMKEFQGLLQNFINK